MGSRSLTRRCSPLPGERPDSRLLWLGSAVSSSPFGRLAALATADLACGRTVSHPEPPTPLMPDLPPRSGSRCSTSRLRSCRRSWWARTRRPSAVTAVTRRPASLMSRHKSRRRANRRTWRRQSNPRSRAATRDVTAGMRDVTTHISSLLAPRDDRVMIA